MFRREVDGVTYPYWDVAGLWGSGNTVRARDGDGTVYTMWDGHALAGPGRPGEIDRYPALVAVLQASEFLDRYAGLGDGCRLWTGKETLGIGCDDACAHVVDTCPDAVEQDCLAACSTFPRAAVGCLADLAVDGCDWEYTCQAPRWAAWPERPTGAQ